MAVFSGKTKDGKPLTGVVYSREFADFTDREKYPWLLEIAIDMERVHDNGMPQREELETINDVEEQIVSAVSTVMVVHKIGRVTGDGIRKVFCYVADGATANTMLSIMHLTKQKRSFRFGITHDETWARAAQLGL